MKVAGGEKVAAHIAGASRRMSRSEAKNLSAPETDSVVPIARPLTAPSARIAEVEVAPSKPTVGETSAGGDDRSPVGQPDQTALHQPHKSHRQLLRTGGSWGFSLLVHLGIMIFLAFLFLPELPALVLPNLEAKVDDIQEEELEPIVEFEPEEVELEQEMTFEQQPETALVENEVNFVPAQDLEAMAAPEVEVLDLGSELAPLLTSVDSLGTGGSGFTGRGHMARIAMVRKGGGTPASEEAVASALRWLAAHQNPDGSWSFDHARSRCQGSV